jgi:hypothetical protein
MKKIYLFIVLAISLAACNSNTQPDHDHSGNGNTYDSSKPPATPGLSGDQSANDPYDPGAEGSDRPADSTAQPKK